MPQFARLPSHHVICGVSNKIYPTDNCLSKCSQICPSLACWMVGTSLVLWTHTYTWRSAAARSRVLVCMYTIGFRSPNKSLRVHMFASLPCRAWKACISVKVHMMLPVGPTLPVPAACSPKNSPASQPPEAHTLAPF